MNPDSASALVSRKSAASLGVAAALAILSSCAEAQVVVNTVTHQFGPSDYGEVSWDPIAGTSDALLESSSNVFVVFGCGGSASLLAGKDTTSQYASVAFTSSALAIGTTVSDGSSWASAKSLEEPTWDLTTFPPEFGIIGNIDKESFKTDGSPFYIGFSFKKNADLINHPDYSYYGYAQIRYLRDGADNTFTIDGFAWNQTPNTSLSVAAVPEPGVTALCMGLASALLVGVRRKWSTLRSLIG